MALSRKEVIKKATSLMGHYGNPNKFTEWYCHDNKKHAFCGMFVKYVFKKELKSDWLDKCENFAYVPTIVSWAKKMKYWNTDFKKAKEGDLVIYNWQPSNPKHYSHVGIVKKAKSSSLVSIEGNTTNGSKSNCVAEKTRSKKYIAGVILLPYKDEVKETKKYYVVKKGDTLLSIAKKYKTTWKKLYKLNKTLIDNDAKKNGIKKNFYNHIYAGQKLRVK